jgi:uncharacterized protein
MKRAFVPKSFDLRVKRSRAGRGLFTYEKIPRGACIIEYTGRPVPKAEMQENTGKYLFWTSRTTMVDGNITTNKARFINHSCAPNCEIHIHKRRIYVCARRSIKPGEELTYDYDTEYFDVHIKPVGCRCAKCSSKRKSKGEQRGHVLPAKQEWCSIRETVFSWTTTRFPFHTSSDRKLKLIEAPIITVTGKAYWDVGHAPKDQSNRRSHLPGYAAWEIHPVMRLIVQ